MTRHIEQKLIAIDPIGGIYQHHILRSVRIEIKFR